MKQRVIRTSVHSSGPRKDTETRFHSQNPHLFPPPFGRIEPDGSIGFGIIALLALVFLGFASASVSNTAGQSGASNSTEGRAYFWGG